MQTFYTNRGAAKELGLSEAGFRKHFLAGTFGMPSGVAVGRTRATLWRESRLPQMCRALAKRRKRRNCKSKGTL